MEDGRLLCSSSYMDKESLVTWLLTFGSKVEVLEPQEIRSLIIRNAEETLALYQNDSVSDI